jgi:iron donor protein CyaY
MIDEQQFARHADEAMGALYRSLLRASEDHPFEADFSAGAMVIEFEQPPAKFVVSPNAPVRQVWVSAQMKSFKLDWNQDRGAFVFAETGESLNDLVAGAIGRQLGEEVRL